MVLLVLENVKPSVRGELSRWLMELKTGVFLGKVSALVRDQLWLRCLQGVGEGGAMLAHPWPNEQGFLVRTAGTLSRDVIDSDGLSLLRRPVSGRATTRPNRKVEDDDLDASEGGNPL